MAENELTPDPTSSERSLPRISFDDMSDQGDLMDADSLKSLRSTGAGSSFAESRSTPTTCAAPSSSSKGPDMQPPTNVVPTDPPPPPPPTKAIPEPPRKKALALLAGMLLAGIILWRIWPWVAPHFGR